MTALSADSFQAPQSIYLLAPVEISDAMGAVFGGVDDGMVAADVIEIRLGFDLGRCYLDTSS